MEYSLKLSYSILCLFIIFWFLEPLVWYWSQLVSVKISGPRELTGAVDLISQFKLLPHHEYFCKRQLPLSISDTHYLHNVVGDTEIRKGEGMQLDQLIEDASFSREMNASIKPFDLDILGEAFQLRETSPIDLPSVRNWLMCVCDSFFGNDVPLFPPRFWSWGIMLWLYQALCFYIVFFVCVIKDLLFCFLVWQGYSDYGGEI